ncbi:MAG: hypothetical protein NXI10_14290 [bacterium]|nr:hypothetical protein [bacterium]
MESFVRRLKYYGIGFGLGLVFVFFFFKNRGCSWTPSNRVKNTILSRMIVVSDDTKAIMDAKGISEKELVQVLNDGDIDFDASDKSRKNKKYLIEKDGVKYVFTLPYESCISEAFISTSVKKVSPTQSGKGEFIHFPNDKNLVFTDSTKFLACQQDQLGVLGDRKIWRKIQKNGVLDFEKTNLKTDGKPEHYIEFVWDKDTIGTKIVWYKEKLNITSFHSDDLEPCK